jgi:PQQ-like domain
MDRRNVILATSLLIVLLAGAAYYALSTNPAGAPSTSAESNGQTTSTATDGNRGTTGDWTTYHQDNARDGFYPAPNFTSVSHDWTSKALDGAIYAEPLVYGNAVLVATENNTVYSLDAQSGAVQWRTNLGTPVPAGSLQCGDINPSGITGTPVVDTAVGTVFVVAFSNLHHFLYGLDVVNGAVISNRSADPPGFVDAAQQQRSALSLANGMVYIPYGGLFGDCGSYHGWVVGLAVNGTGKMDVYQVPTTREGGIWAASGAVVTTSGDVYLATGNGASGTTLDHGDSVVGLSPTLSELGYFAPTNWAQLNEEDADLGSAGPSIVGPDTLFQIGKEGMGYLLSTSRLGGIGGQLFTANVCSGSFGGNAYAAPMLYVPCTDGLFALRVGAGSFSEAWVTSSFYAGPPIVTGGVVWVVDVSSATLYGYGAASGAKGYSFPLGSVAHFCTPSAGDGRVFVGANLHVVAFVLGAV